MGALDGIVVLDLARRYPGAFAAMYLGDHGASVIKVDPPASVSKLQRTTLPEDRYAAFYPQDRNKRSVILDLKQEAGREALCRLVARADVLIEGFRPGVMDRLGVGYARLSAINPGLVYCALSAFGQTGPYAEAGMPAHDGNFNGFAGILSLIGERNGKIYRPSNLVGDYGGGTMHTVVGVLLALMARAHTGRGQFVDVAYLDSVIALSAPNTWEYFATGVVPRRGETRTSGSIPPGHIFRCKDGEYVVVEPGERHHWENFCRALGREDLSPYSRPTDIKVTEWVVAELAAIFATRTRDEWWALLEDKNVCATPVLNVDETFRDPQVLSRDMLVELDHPKFGKVRQVGIGIKLSDTPGQVRHTGVPTGTDTEAVLEEIGYGTEQIAELRKQGVLG